MARARRTRKIVGSHARMGIDSEVLDPGASAEATPEPFVLEKLNQIYRGDWERRQLQAQVRAYLAKHPWSWPECGEWVDLQGFVYKIVGEEIEITPPRQDLRSLDAARGAVHEVQGELGELSPDFTRIALREVTPVPVDEAAGGRLGMETLVAYSEGMEELRSMLSQLATLNLPEGEALAESLEGAISSLEVVETSLQGPYANEAVSTFDCGGEKFGVLVKYTLREGEGPSP